LLPEQPGDVERTCADISKAREMLGYNPQVSFEEGIARTADWYRLAHSQGLFDESPKAAFPDESRMRRVLSDLELSSFVEKAPAQVTDRTERMLSSTNDSSER
jgi:GDP-mannose 4,6 dehydratase